MEGILRVTPERLSAASSEFASTAATVNQLTQEMLQVIRSTNSIWQGEDATAYTQKFNSLDEDMQQMYRMITEHSTDLQEMATNYTNAIYDTTETANSMKTNVIS